jgi:SAM-dependent methyltransferase
VGRLPPAPPDFDATATLDRRRGDYGVDAPYVPLGLGAASGLFLATAGALARWRPTRWALVPACYGTVLLVGLASFLYTTRRGKLAVWADLLRGLLLRGDERVLDLGCGRGAVLLMAAQLLSRGRAVGIDLWKAADQSGNDPGVTRRNAALEGVTGNVDLCTGDLRALPFKDGSFDLVLSSLAVHNVPDRAGRAQAVDEAGRVLRPGGRLLIADYRETAGSTRRGSWSGACGT